MEKNKRGTKNVNNAFGHLLLASTKNKILKKQKKTNNNNSNTDLQFH